MMMVDGDEGPTSDIIFSEDNMVDGDEGPTSDIIFSEDNMVDGDEGPTSDIIFSEDNECDDVLLDIDSFWRVMGGIPDPPQSEGSGVEDLPSSAGGVKVSNEDDLPGFDVLTPPNNSEATDFRRGYSNGFTESAWDFDIPDSLRVETSSQSHGNDVFYSCPNGDLQNASFSCQNGDLYTKNLMEGADFNSFAQMENSPTIDGDKMSHDASNTESSSCEIAGVDITDMLSENGDLNLFNAHDPPYFSNGSGYGQFVFEDGIVDHSLSSVSHMIYLSRVKDEHIEKETDLRRTLPFVMAGKNPFSNTVTVSPDFPEVLHATKQQGMLALPSMEDEVNCLKLENEVLKVNSFHHGKITDRVVQNSTCIQSNIDNDPDLCILEERSTPARPNYIAANAKSATASHILASRNHISQMGTGPSRLKANDERVIFQVALQDLSQPKLEATPPDGVLSVPLLKHQRIALSWMVNKETKSGCCSGGILADDQGLGKTVSTIALILKERSPSTKAHKANEKQRETETLNLDEDDDDDGTMETCSVTDGVRFSPVNECSIRDGNASLQAKGRPSGGTLIVCPTSVLRQWSEELHSKVTSEAALSVLVYYGSNRIKDPLELAKYDVVVTTYAIVSMEVPKQPVVNDNEDQMGSSFKEFSSCKKRKLMETNGKKTSTSKKSKKGIDNELLESISGPLAKVGWFRVVLDEAQSIKNHRTQVARACWGLRAKRRWCLSGTPIQNSIDDLYSYFRFLRHEPYAVFKTFCEQLKVPVHRNPKNGYKKLQAVLKTIMLRRTKGMFLDGQPIINLPPKTIELKRIDFSQEERDFYCRLEAESRAQFAEYAAAGTVKQNYVNILLMLLRLRQACDHPVLVKGFNSTSRMTNSIEAAKKLPREKQAYLLNCLEASLAICGICNDPPEDAVVTACGHVFCNQCICEHMIGDDTQCPAKKCKNSLTMARAFSTTALRISLSDQQPNSENTTTSTLSVAEFSEPPSLKCPEDSSKIKAALGLLLSMSKPEDSDVRMNSEELQVCDSREINGTSEIKCDSNNSRKGEKAIVFSQWTGMLDLLESCLKSSSIQYRRLDGTMPVVARDRAVKDFNTLPQVSVMIMSLKAASLGLNMVAACNVILLDLWWNPTTEDQAVDRAHRIGQNRPVSVFRLTVKDTVEDRILALQQRKRKMVASAFGEDESGSRQTRLTVEDLKYLFRS